MKGRALAPTALAAAALAVLASCEVRPAYKVTTARAERRDLTASVNATGALEPVVKVLVGSQVSGRIQELHADFNARVRKGQLLARIDPSAFRAKVQQAEAQLAKARATLLDAQRGLKRSQELTAARIGAQADLDTSRTKVALADADVQQAVANLAQARVDFSNTEIFSPIDGVVISRDVEAGQTVAASLSAPTLFTISDDLSRLQIVANVDEADVGQVAEGQPIKFTVDAFPGTSFGGKVSAIRNRPESAQGVVTYETVIQVANEEQKLRPGMTANVRVVVAQKKGVLAVPNAALRVKPPEDLLAEKPKEGDEPDKDKKSRKKKRGVAYSWKEGRLEPIEVKLGIGDGSYTEVLEGLAEGQEVVTGIKSGGSQEPARSPFGAGKKT